MALFLLPLFFVALYYTVLAVANFKNQCKTVIVILIGFVVLGLTFPVSVAVLNGLSGGLIENRLEYLWSIAEMLTIANGDIYIGGIGLMLIIFNIVLTILQVLLTRSRL